MSEFSDKQTAFRVARFFSDSVRHIKHMSPGVVRIHLRKTLSKDDTWKIYKALAHEGPIVLEIVPPAPYKGEEYD